MPDIKKLIDQAVAVADTAAAVIPTVSGIATIGAQLVNILQDLRTQAPDIESKEKLEIAHDKLVAATTAKAEATSDRLRG